MRIRLNEKNIPLIATACVCVLLFAGASMQYEGFASARNIVNMVTGNAFLGVVAIGMTFVILSGGIDLSVGSVVALAGIVIGRAVTQNGWHPGIVIPAVLLGGLLFGATLGSLIHFTKLPPFLVTLAGMFLARGLGYVTSNAAISLDHPWYRAASAWGVPLTERLSVPLVALVFVAMLLASAFLAHLTRFGRNVYAIGGGEQSAVLMGLPVGRTKVGVYALSGFCAALGGVLHTINTASADPQAGIALELDAIAAVVIGGTLLTGGVGYVVGTLFGVLILGTIQTAIYFQGTLSAWWARIAIGLLLFAFIAMQKLVANVSAKGTGLLAAAAAPPRAFDVVRPPAPDAPLPRT